MGAIKADICVIGAGSAGLSVAAGAAQLGRKTVLIEAGTMGGDCLNSGCVPSKALLAAAAAAQGVREAAGFGVEADAPRIDGAAVHAHVADVISRIAPHDSQERFEKLGCTVIRAHARFIDEHTVEAGGTQIRARRFVIATGSRPVVLQLPGLSEISYFTNETIFEKDFIPPHLLIVGGGPIGCEMAQAHRRLGSAVTIVEAARLLPRDDVEAAGLVRDGLRHEGIQIFESSQVTSFRCIESGGIEAQIVTRHGSEILRPSHVLMAVGRRPNHDDLGLERADIDWEPNGIAVDHRMRTTNKRVYAIGDVTGGPQFTHAAGYQAGLVIRNALFRLPVRANYSSLPRVTYTDPELAQVGLTEEEARARNPRLRVSRASFAENDRAVAMRDKSGFAKLVADRRGRLIGATIVGPHAGELIAGLGLAIAQSVKLSALAGQVIAYPTLAEISKRAAGAWFTPSLFSARTRALVRMLSWFG
jgi:pyruvate/2-oxoglutarate dehydrogenase complex dihydrolipoamide dehydrogenase (E3) component